MTNLVETPAMFFLHDWSTGPAEKLATGFKAALAELGKPSGRAARRQEGAVRWITRENIKGRASIGSRDGIEILERFSCRDR